MFSLRKTTKTSSTVSFPEKPAPTILEPRVNALGTYEELAKKLDFFPAQLFDEQLLRFLSEENIPIFDYDKVDAYLAALAEAQGKVWVWRPLRKKDKPVDWSWSGRLVRKKDETRWHGAYHDSWSYRPYDKAVPIYILRQVKKIQEKFCDHALFFVSDYAVPNPDPFIMVTVQDGQKIVFGVWDEPGFGED